MTEKPFIDTIASKVVNFCQVINNSLLNLNF